MNILVACEESQAVTIEMRKKGHNAFSCDLIDCSGQRPEWHIKQDVLPLLNGNCLFTTCDGESHYQHSQWDMTIAFPPCTHLCSSGARWFAEGKKPMSLREDAIRFFMAIANANCEHIAIENPVGIMSSHYRKPDQIIQPWQFGHPETKATCLWLKNLPKLSETNNVKQYMLTLPAKERNRIWYMGGGHAKERSKTLPGIALAMAEQWGGYADG